MQRIQTEIKRLEHKKDDIVITAAFRTPICKAFKGYFNITSPIALLVPVFKKILESGIDPKLVEDIVVGNVQAPGMMRHVECRIASFLAGFPETTCLQLVNRQCSSGLQALATVAASISSGYIDIGIAAGVETMSIDSKYSKMIPNYDEIYKNSKAMNCLLPMGITSENVAKMFGISRETQDQIGYRSQKCAASAQEKFQQEIVPISTTYKDHKTGDIKNILVEHDQGIRPNTTLSSLSKLKPSFQTDGKSTAGNSSQISDGASALLIMKRSKAKELNLPILGTFRSFSVKGVPPEIMGIGPASAIPSALNKAGLNISDIDLIEINEAFASQLEYCVKTLKIPWEKVNKNGGAIALGHPLGCTGNRMVVTLLHEMKRSKMKLGVISMCVGTGMGAASVFEC